MNVEAQGDVVLIGDLSEQASVAVLRPKESFSLPMKQPITRRPVVHREAFLFSQLDPDKSILHLGCSDAPFTGTMIKSGELLHSRLLAKAPKVTGYDISAPHLELLRKRHPEADFVLGNAENLQESFRHERFDLVLAGEILEHLCNPGLFFEGCRNILKPDGRLILTVPNTFGFRRFIHNLMGVENYHPEHTFYFSENTIRFLASKYGFEINRSFYYPTETRGSALKACVYFLAERLPSLLFGSHFLEGIIIELKPKP